MRALIQRVTRASVTVDGAIVGSIGPGLLVFLGIHIADRKIDADWLVRKVTALRIFDDADGKLNRSVVDVRGSLLVVSQFTLYGDIRKGNRPSYATAAPPGPARQMYQYFIEQCRRIPGLDVETGIFQASMSVELLNDGPVTIWCETEPSQDVLPVEGEKNQN